MRFILYVINLLFLGFYSAAQDTPQKQLNISFNFEVSGQQHLYEPYNSRISQPAPIKRVRQATTRLPIGFDSVTDNPFRHGAMYVALKSVTNFKKKIRLNADLYGEYRGFSYGTFNTRNNLVLFPVISLEGHDTLHIGNKNLIIAGKLGQFLNEQLAEGLTIYNLDVQGTQLRLRYKNSQLAFTIYGDLSQAIGLNIDDLKELSFEQYGKNNSTRYGVSWTMAAPAHTQVKYNSYFNLYGSADIKNRTRLYAQFGFMPVLNNYFGAMRGFTRQTALVAGIEKKISHKKLFFKNKTELRYYGHTFNLFHSDLGFRYRDSATNQYDMYANTTGAFLYPLRKFNTPFSQWAVFTEYSGYNLGALSFTGQCDYQLNPKLTVGADYDLYAIWAILDKGFYSNPGEKRSSFFVYPFFKASIRYTPLKECYVALFITNKSMNLDISYPTHYLHKRPFLGIELYCKI